MPLWPSRQNSSPATSSNATAPGPSTPSEGPSGTRQSGVSRLFPPSAPSLPLPFIGSPPKSRSYVPTKSQTFPSLFGGGKKKQADLDDEEGADMPELQTPSRVGPFTKSASGKGKLSDNELESFVCATCSGTIRQPKGLKQFRCTACSMVNDLRVAPDLASAGRDISSSTIVTPLSIERTRTIINACLGDFWDQRQKVRSTRRSTNQPAAARSLTPGSHQQSQFPALIPSQVSSAWQPNKSPVRLNALHSTNRTLLPSAPSVTMPMRTMLNAASMSSRPEGKASQPNWESPDQQDHEKTNKRIFKPLEEYLVQCFKGAECLNASFTLSRPTSPPRFEPEVGKPYTSAPPASRPEMHKEDMNMSELDAKTLLLGDVAENGLWWTGRGDRANSRPRVRLEKSSDRVRADNHSRSPNINWKEVDQWYEVVVNVGENWRDVIQELQQSKGTASTLEHDEIVEIDNALAEARNHTQRMLLKASESLLKRPGRPLKNLGDVRFLVILLANPLMFRSVRVGSVANGRSESTPLADRPIQENDRKEQTPPIRTTATSSPEHFVVLRRILGLLSGISNENQRYIAAWFARYNEKHFRNLVELLQSFLTHRLSRRPQHGRVRSNSGSPGGHLVPELSASDMGGSARLHAVLGLGSQPKIGSDNRQKVPLYSDDWSIRAAAKVLALLYAANRMYQGRKTGTDSETVALNTSGPRTRGRLLVESDFYNTMVEFVDLVTDFEAWEKKAADFTLCQYPFLLSMGAKIRILEHDARRQMEIKAREAFFNSILRNKTMEQYLILKVRRDCLVDDSLKSISEVVGAGQEEIKKGLKVQFMNEEGIDAGGLRKEWFLLLVREIFDPNHGMFVYDEDSRLCYFNPYSFETSDQYYLVGALLGLAIYNSTILDVALPPFVFKKLLMSSSTTREGAQHSFARFNNQHTLDDLAEYRPALAEGLRQLLSFEGNVEETFCRDFVVSEERYGQTINIELCDNGASRPVTNSNRQEFVDLYIRHELDSRVAKQFEPFKRGFMTVCGGNALSLFQPEEIEQLIRGSDEPLDVDALKGVATYENFRRANRDIANPAEEVALVRWFWDFFTAADPKMQRKLLSFITGSDRIPAVGATSLVIRVVFGGMDDTRYPVARTCFNSLRLYGYRTREELARRLTRAVMDSEGFGLR